MAVRMITLNGDTPEAWRLALSLFGHPSASAVIDRRGGLAPGGTMAPGGSPAWLGAGDTAMTGVVGPFIAWVDGTSGASQGGYIVHNDGWLPISYEPGEPAVARTDRVIIQVRDNAYDSSGASDARVLVLKGNSGGGATDLPASSEMLWEVAVPAGASIGGGGFNIDGVGVRTDRRRWVASNGGLLLVRDAADRDTLTPHEGMQIWRLDAGDPQVYRGGGWRWAGVPRTAVKTAAESVNNDTYQADNHLSLNLPVGTWDIEVFGNYSADTDQDIKIGFTAPAASTMTWLVMGKGGTTQADGPLGEVDWIPQDVTGEPRLGGRVTSNNTDWMGFMVRGWLTTTTAGALTLKWAQNVTSAGVPTWMHPGSRMIATRVGD